MLRAIPGGRRMLLVLSAMIIGLALMPAARASTSARRTFTWHAHEDDIGGIVTPQSCGLSQTGLCTVTYSGSTSWSGDFTGTSNWKAYGHYNPDAQQFEAEVWEYFPEVTVKHCGTGAMMWHGKGFVTGPEQDPASLSIKGHGTWTFQRGTGTGELASVTDGRFDISDINFGIPFLDNHEDVTGTITCAAPATRP